MHSTKLNSVFDAIFGSNFFSSKSSSSNCQAQLEFQLRLAELAIYMQLTADPKKNFHLFFFTRKFFYLTFYCSNNIFNLIFPLKNLFGPKFISVQKNIFELKLFQHQNFWRRKFLNPKLFLNKTFWFNPTAFKNQIFESNFCLPFKYIWMTFFS